MSYYLNRNSPAWNNERRAKDPVASAKRRAANEARILRSLAETLDYDVVKASDRTSHEQPSVIAEHLLEAAQALDLEKFGPEDLEQYLGINDDFASIRQWTLRWLLNVPSHFDFVVDLKGKFRQYGDLSDAQVKGVANCALADAKRNQGKAEQASKPLVGAGIYRLPDGSIAKVQASKTTGRLYALRHVSEKSWAYEAGLIHKLEAEWKLDLEAAKAYGRETGICCVCGATLTDPKSVEAGIGPICASKGF